ncbi:MAG TPA: hypothetical protein DEQ14_05845 [Treponema sp.]|nr:hypothetical protein [Treponema sp.]
MRVAVWKQSPFLDLGSDFQIVNNELCLCSELVIQVNVAQIAYKRKNSSIKFIIHVKKLD